MLAFPVGAADYGHTAAILSREQIPGTDDTPYTHPADMCQLRNGALLIMYNGDPDQLIQAERDAVLSPRSQ